MKKIAIALTVIASISLTGCQATKQAQQDSLNSNIVDINDRMINMTRGVVLTFDPVKVKPEQLKNQSAQVVGSGLVAGGLGGALISRSRDGLAIGLGTALIGGLTLLADGLSEPDLVDAYRYTVQSQKTGDLLEVYQVDTAPIIEGSSVFVRAYQSGRLTVRLDTTQGQVFQRANDTNFAGKGRLTAQERKEKLEDVAFERTLRNDKTDEVLQEQYRKALKIKTEKLSETIDAKNKALRNSKTTNINIQ